MPRHHTMRKNTHAPVLEEDPLPVERRGFVKKLFPLTLSFLKDGIQRRDPLLVDLQVFLGFRWFG